MSNNLKNKLYNYKESPPSGAWKQILASLDAESLFPGKLYNYASTPPSHLWSDIKNKLDEVEQVKPVRYIRKRSKIITYSAAAAILFAIVFGASKLLSNRSAPASPVSSIVQPVEQKSTTGNIQPPPAPVITNEPEKELAAATPHETKHTFKSIFFHEKMVKEIIPVEDNHLAVETPVITPVAPSINNHPDLSLADRFMVYTDDEGNHMKLAKKLFSLVHCNNDDYSCKQNLQNLQQKISSASVSADFGGFLDMLKQLQENQ